MTKNVDHIADYTSYLGDAVKVGRKVCYDVGIVQKLEKVSSGYSDKPGSIFLEAERVLLDEFDKVNNRLEIIKQPIEPTWKDKGRETLKRVKTALRFQPPEIPDANAEANKLVPDLTELTYLSTVMRETIVISQKYKGKDGVITEDEFLFLVGQYPSLFKNIAEARDMGAEFDYDTINEIRRITKKETNEFIRNLQVKVRIEP